MEMTMKALLASVAALAAVSAALPAAAQSWDRGWDRPGYQQDFRRGGSEAARIARRIDIGERNGSLTRREAALLRRDLQQVQRLEWRLSRDGRIGPREARQLDRRYAELSARVRFERRDDDRRYGYGYGYGR